MSSGGEFRIQFLPAQIIVTVNPDSPPRGDHGRPGSILDLALGSNIEIDHACGGVLACATCHIKVMEGAESCTQSTEEEEDQLDKAPDLSFRSRLACQCVPDGSRDLIVEIPGWNRNLVKETPH